MRTGSPARSDGDVFVIGAGINGAGIAREVARRGPSVVPAEQGDLTEAEFRWLADGEFARTAEDVLRRRSKLGLHMFDAGRAELATWLDGERRDTPTGAQLEEAGHDS